MPRFTISNFNAGLLSPLVGARSDSDKYVGGALQFQNALPHVQGPASKRPGTQYVVETKDSTTVSRAIPFVYSTNQKATLELGVGYIRFISSGDDPDYIDDPGNPGTPLEYVTPYTAADLPDIQFKNINDTVRFVHPSHHPQILTRVADDEWTWAEVAWDFPPLLDPNLDTSLTMTASATTGTGITLTASSAYFTSDNVGSYFTLSHYRTQAYAEIAFSGNGSSTAIRLIGDYSVNTYGTWDGDVILEKSATGAAPWEAIKIWHSTQDYTVNAVGSEPDETYLRLTFANRVFGSGTDYARLETSSAEVVGLVKATGYTSTTVLTVDVINDLHATTATTFWSEGAFSDRRGYPRTVTLHQTRIVYAGTADQPNTIHLSQLDDFDNFRRSTLDAGAMAITLATERTDPIQWIQAARGKLLLGTAAQEFIIESSNDVTTLTPTTIEANDQTYFGSDYAAAVVAAELVLFLTPGARALREFVYSFEQDRYVAPDLNLLSDRLTLLGGFTAISVQRTPQLIIWCVGADGNLYGLTYERAQNVAAWHKHTTDGTFESVSVIPGTSPGWDEVYVIVNRTIDGATARYVERLAPLAHYRQSTSDVDDLEFLDSCLTLTSGTATTAWSGLSHLEGETVRILADGARQPDVTVTAGDITIDAAASKVVVGLPYTMRIQPMPATFELKDGTSRGRKIRIERVQLDLLDSLGVSVTDDPDDSSLLTTIPDRTTSMDMDTPVPLFSGITDEFPVPGSHRYLSTFAVESDSPYPVTLRAINLTADAHGS